VLERIPGLLTLLVLVGLGYWGHHHNWRLPAFGQFFGHPGTEHDEDWCAEHGVPESKCIRCRPALVGADPADWCSEHGVPESNCTICRPGLIAGGEPAAAGRATKAADGDCGGEDHDHEAHAHASRSTSPLSSAVGKDPATCQTHAQYVQLASVATLEKAGVRLAPVSRRPMREVLEANAEVDYDRTRLAQVASRAAGVVYRVEKEVGQRVRQGELLALIDAAEVGKLKAELLQSAARRQMRMQSLERARRLHASRIGTDADLQEAEVALREAEVDAFVTRQALVNLGFILPPDPADGALDPQTLLYLGLPETLRTEWAAGATSANLLPLQAPLDGEVVRREAVAGELADPTRTLFVIADVSGMWLMIDLPQAQAARVALGQPVRFVPDGAAELEASGAVSWISTAVDRQTRTVKVRARVDNPAGRLRAGMFGRALITVGESPDAIVVPDEAVQWEGCCHVVFVRAGEDIFRPRKVQPGARGDGFTEVLVGVLPDEIVATAGSHVLKSELLKGNLGPGCGGD